MVLAELVVPLPISFQITTKMKITDSKHSRLVFHVNVILVSMVLVITTGEGGRSAGEIIMNYIMQCTYNS